MSDNRLSNSVMTFVVGLGIGALVGILFAPKPGEETRQNLSGGARDAVNTVVATGQKITQDAKQSVTETADQIRDAVLEGERAYTHAKSA